MAKFFTYLFAAIFIIAAAAGLIYLQGWIAAWVHTQIHPSSVFAGGNPWVYGLALSILQDIFRRSVTVKTAK